MNKSANEKGWGNLGLTPARLSALCLLLMLVAIGCINCSRGATSAVRQPLDKYKEAGRRIEYAARFVNQVLSAPHLKSEIIKLPARRTPPVAPPPHIVEPGHINFRLTGIVGNRQNAMVMTTAGSAGQGGEVDGFKIVEIEEDAVVFADRSGKQQRIRLYEDVVEP